MRYLIVGLIRGSLSLCLHVNIKCFVGLVLTGVYVKLCHCLLGGHSFYSYRGQDPNVAWSTSDVSFLRVNDSILQGSICSLWWLITAGMQWKALFSFLSALDLGEQAMTQQQTIIKPRFRIKQKPECHHFTRSQNMAAVGVTICLFLVTMVMKTLY